MCGRIAFRCELPSSRAGQLPCMATRNAYLHNRAVSALPASNVSIRCENQMELGEPAGPSAVIASAVLETTPRQPGAMGMDGPELAPYALCVKHCWPGSSGRPQR